MSASRIPRFRYLVLLWLFGGLCMGLVTGLCFRFGLNISTTILAYLIVIVFLSLLDSLISSVVFSLIAVGCLNYFFVQPLFTLHVTYGQDFVVLIAFVVTSLVITGLVRRIRRLADAHREQARLLDLTHDTVLVRDMNDVITFWNRGAEELYGWTRQESRGKISHELLKTTFPEPLKAITKKLIQAGRWEGELAQTKRDGTQVTVSSRWAIQRDERGKIVGTLETNNDITERRRAQELLRRSQAAYLTEAQKLSLTGSFGWNVSDGEIFWSDENFRIFGYDPALKPTIEMVLQRVHPDDIAAVRATTESAKNDLKDFDIEHRLLLPDGTVKYVHVVARFTTYEPGISQFVGAVMDVTAAKDAERQLQRTQSDLAHISRVTSLGELTASIAHEVGQPLAAIVTHAEASLRWLGREVPEIDEATVALGRIVNDGNRASDIVQRIRSLIKKADQERCALRLNEMIEDVIPLLQREILEHRIGLQLELAKGLPQVLGDPVQLQQVIINLVVNAIQAMTAIDSRPRDLVIRSRQGETGTVLVAIQDSGEGLSEAAMSRLFGPFYTTKPNGMGMGLSICRSIIEAHNGRIWATAGEGGLGASFQFSLPATPME